MDSPDFESWIRTREREVARDIVATNAAAEKAAEDLRIAQTKAITLRGALAGLTEARKQYLEYGKPGKPEPEDDDLDNVVVATTN